MIFVNVLLLGGSVRKRMLEGFMIVATVHSPALSEIGQ